MRAYEFIPEIATIGSRLEPIEKYQHHFVDVPKTPAFDELMFGEKIDDDSVYLGLFKAGQLVSILYLMIRDEPYYQVTYSQTEPEFQGLGCFRYLLEYAVLKYDNILSDDHQTPEAGSAWRALSAFPGSRVHYFIYDTQFGSKSRITRHNYDEIWNGDPNPLLLASKINYPTKLQEHIIRDNEIKKKIGRDYNSLFYGESAINDSFINP